MIFSAAVAIQVLLSGSMLSQTLPTGERITPLAAPGSAIMMFDPALAEMPGLRLGFVVNAVLSPDRRLLAVVTAGPNVLYDAKGQPVSAAALGDFLLLYDVTATRPRRVATFSLAASYGGLAWRTDSAMLYAALGSADAVGVFEQRDGHWRASRTSIALGHANGRGVFTNNVKPLAAGVAVIENGRRLAVANRMNDSVSLVDPVSGTVSELKLQPGGGRPGGTDPYWIAATAPDRIWITSQRDRELIGVATDGNPRVIARIALKGVPNRVVADRAGRRLYVAEDNADLIEVVDPVTARIVAAVPTLPDTPHRSRGASPNSLALSPDERWLYVTNGGVNAVAVIALAGAPPRLAGLIPTGWYPSAVAVTAQRLFVVNSKRIAGPNRTNCDGFGHMTLAGDCALPGAGKPGNGYILQLMRSDLLTLPLPPRGTLAGLTRTVRANARLDARVAAADAAVMAQLRQKVRHVIYVVKENRSYDQVLGDLPRANGDPRLTQFGRALTPNQHALAETFVTLDNFSASGEVSGDGWQWSTAGRASDTNEKLIHSSYAGHGGSYDSEGVERDVNVALGSNAERRRANPLQIDDDDLLPGTHNSVEIDGPEDEPGLGYLWDSALRAGKTVRNYGFFADLTRYDFPAEKGGIATLEDPAASATRVTFPANKALALITDPYFRAFDTKLPDFFREAEWEREFGAFVTDGALPALSLVRLGGDHTGDFLSAIRGVNTPETQVADNDYAVGKLVEAVARSRYANDTVVIVVEDDAQSGPDHVDAHRSPAYFAGAYVRRGLVSSTHYNTVDVIRTIEELLGLDPANLFDRGARPMAEIFDPSMKPEWTFEAQPADVLYSTQLPLSARRESGPIMQPRHDAQWWAAATQGFDWSGEDRNDPAQFNAVLERGLRPPVITDASGR